MQRERPALRFGLILAAALALAGCTSDREVGSDYEVGGFGNATMNNTLMMSGERNIAISLTKKFAADVQNTVNFAFNSSTLDGQAQEILRRQADWIKQFPEVRFRVYGHTDLVGSDAYNQALGKRTADQVYFSDFVVQ